jgi:CBS domain-containing protein
MQEGDMSPDREPDNGLLGDEEYFQKSKGEPKVFDANVLHEPMSVLPTAEPLVYAPSHPVSDAMQDMQNKRRGCVLVSEDGTSATRLIGIFTERDVLRRIVGRGRNPATLPLREVITRDPECLPLEATVAWVLNKMALGGFRHVPIVDDGGRPAFVVSVRDVVQFLVDFFPRDVLNMPPEFGADKTRAREGA